MFADRADLEVASAGLRADADTPVSAELLDWADVILVMERAHRARLARRFNAHLGRARLVCLDIPDRYAFMDPDLVQLLRGRAAPHLA